jgi:hypothetical protein
MAEQYHSRYEQHVHHLDTLHDSWNRDVRRETGDANIEHHRPQPPSNDGESTSGYMTRGRADPNTDGQSSDEQEAVTIADDWRPRRSALVNTIPNRAQLDSVLNSPRGRPITRPRGVSTYRVTTGPPVSGLWNSEQYHQDVMLSKVRRNVEWKVGQELTAPAGVKQPKLSEPNKYSGSRSHDSFCNWLDQFLSWLRSHYITGVNTDVTCINLLGNYLEGAALD